MQKKSQIDLIYFLGFLIEEENKYKNKIINNLINEQNNNINLDSYENEYIDSDNEDIINIDFISLDIKSKSYKNKLNVYAKLKKLNKNLTNTISKFMQIF